MIIVVIISQGLRADDLIFSSHLSRNISLDSSLSLFPIINDYIHECITDLLKPLTPFTCSTEVDLHPTSYNPPAPTTLTAINDGFYSGGS